MIQGFQPHDGIKSAGRFARGRLRCTHTHSGRDCLTRAYAGCEGRGSENDLTVTAAAPALGTSLNLPEGLALMEMLDFQSVSLLILRTDSREVNPRLYQAT